MQKAYFPMAVLRVTQGRGVGSHRGTCAIDLGGRDTGRDRIYAPCDMKIVRVRTDKANNGEVYAQSVGPVLLPDGSASVLHFTFIHDDACNAGVKQGAVIKQGMYFYDEGGKKGGRAGVYGAHLHLEVGKGDSPAHQVQNAQGCWGTPKTAPIEQLLWLKPETTILADGGYQWKTDRGEDGSMMQFLEIFGSKNCQCFTAADVNKIDTAYNNGTLYSGTCYPLLADVGTSAEGYHWVRVFAGGASRYAVVLDDRSRVVRLSAGDAIPAVLAQCGPVADIGALQKRVDALTVGLREAEKKAASAQAKAADAENSAKRYLQRINAARAALEG